MLESGWKISLRAVPKGVLIGCQKRPLLGQAEGDPGARPFEFSAPIPFSGKVGDKRKSG